MRIKKPSLYTHTHAQTTNKQANKQKHKKKLAKIHIHTIAKTQNISDGHIITEFIETFTSVT